MAVGSLSQSSRREPRAAASETTAPASRIDRGDEQPDVQRVPERRARGVEDLPEDPGMRERLGGDDRVREDRERRVRGQAAVRDGVDDELLEVRRDAEAAELARVSSLTSRPLITAPRIATASTPPSCAARVHGRGRHARPLRPARS